MRNPVKTIRDNFAIRSFEKRYAATAKLVAPYVNNDEDNPELAKGLRAAFRSPTNPSTLDLKTLFKNDNGDTLASATVRLPQSTHMLDLIAMKLAADKLKPSVQWVKANIEGRLFVADRPEVEAEVLPMGHNVTHLAEIIKAMSLRLAVDQLEKNARENNVTKISLDIPGLDHLPQMDELQMQLTKSISAQHHAVFDIEYF